MKLEEYLQVPYVVAASSESRDDGTWERVVECPELPQCRVSAPSIVDAMDALTKRRIATIVALLGAGDPPPVPRPRLQGYDVEEDLRRLGLLDELADLLKLHESELRGKAIPALHV